ncbi:unnamed protein product [Lactuca saligna]|uniref:Uncharacterized protein n=1 Tax=Lactuca saligna TaxID=75948 RepID=A0AA36DZQ7_LACSI|nr:unnamed protein product [Lactuca saligna]
MSEKEPDSDEDDVSETCEDPQKDNLEEGEFDQNNESEFMAVDDNKQVTDGRQPPTTKRPMEIMRELNSKLIGEYVLSPRIIEPNYSLEIPNT